MAPAESIDLPTQSPVQATIVFDFDGTLVRGDCGGALLQWLLRRNPLRFLLALALAPLLMPLLGWPACRRWAISVFLWIATTGLKPERFDALLARFVERYPLRPIAPALSALREEVSRGHRVVIATGAFAPLADGLLRRLEVREQVALVGSQARRWGGGWVVVAQCNREEKVRQLHARGFPGPYLRAYSDTWSDYPLLDSADAPVLVNGDDDARRKLRQRYGKRLRVVAWA